MLESKATEQWRKMAQTNICSGEINIWKGWYEVPLESNMPDFYYIRQRSINQVNVTLTIDPI